MSEKIKFNYSVSDFENVPDTIRIEITGSGLTLHKDHGFLEELAKRVGVEMYAHANNINLDDCKVKLS